MKKRTIMARIYIAISLILIVAIAVTGASLNPTAYDYVIELMTIRICALSICAIALTLFIVGVIELTLIRREQSHKEIE